MAHLLLVFVLVVIPLVGLIGLRTQVSPQRVSWRLGILAAMLGLIILGIGWLWARSVIWHFQGQERFVAIGGASRGEDYRFWGSTLPGCVTGICSIIYVLFLTAASATRAVEASCCWYWHTHSHWQSFTSSFLQTLNLRRSINTFLNWSRKL